MNHIEIIQYKITEAIGKGFEPLLVAGAVN